MASTTIHTLSYKMVADTQQFTHHQFAGRDGCQQNLNDAVGFFFNSIAEQILDTLHQRYKNQIDKTHGGPLPEGIRQADLLVASDFAWIQAADGQAGALNFAHGINVDVEFGIFLLTDRVIDTGLNGIGKPCIGQVAGPILQTSGRGIVSHACWHRRRPHDIAVDISRYQDQCKQADLIVAGLQALLTVQKRSQCLHNLLRRRIQVQARRRHCGDSVRC